MELKRICTFEDRRALYMSRKVQMRAAAHIIAQNVILYVIDKVWVKETSTCICDIIGKDFSCL